MKRYIKYIFILVLLMPQYVTASDEGGYFGLGIGQAKADVYKSKIVTDYPTVSNKASIDNTNYGLRVFAGYWFDPYLGMELSMHDVPEFKATESGVRTDLFAMFNVGIFALARKEFGKHELFAKVGINSWEVCQSSGCDTKLDSGQGLAYGAGINLNLYDSKARMMRIEWEHSAIDSVYLKKLDVISINIVFNFGTVERDE